MTPLRWCMVATHVPAAGRLGGVVRYTVEVMRALSARPDIVLSVLTTKGSADALREVVGPGVRIDTVPDVPVPMLSAVERRAPLALLRRDCDVVHGSKHLVPHRTGAVRVLTVHDLLLLDRPHDFGAAKRILLPGPYRASIRESDLLVCVSDATRARLEACVPGSDDRAITVPLATSGPLRDAVPIEVPGLAGRRYALVVGDPTPRKNLRTLMAAWPSVLEQRPDAVLAIAGPPTWGRTEVGTQFQQLVDAGAVLPLGHVDDGALRWAYEHAGVVLCPSLAEGFGLPAAEALDLGAQVVVSDDPALVEVSRGRARSVVRATDVPAWTEAILAALSDDGRAVRAGRGEPDRTWNDVADETVTAARAVLSSRLSRRGVE